MHPEFSALKTVIMCHIEHCHVSVKTLKNNSGLIISACLVFKRILWSVYSWPEVRWFIGAEWPLMTTNFLAPSCKPSAEILLLAHFHPALRQEVTEVIFASWISNAFLTDSSLLHTRTVIILSYIIAQLFQEM